MEHENIAESLRERYHSTLGYVHATLEQQTLLLEKHQIAEAEWKAERESLRHQLRELSEAFSDLKARAIEEQLRTTREMEDARTEFRRQSQLSDEQHAAAQEQMRKALAAAREQAEAHKASTSVSRTELETALSSARR